MKSVIIVMAFLILLASNAGAGVFYPEISGDAVYGDGADTIEELVFEDGTILTVADIRELLLAQDDAQLVDYEGLGDDAILAVPTPDHYLPLLQRKHRGLDRA